MNTEASQENISKTTGERLRQAREQLGLSQQAVAERLCLKVSTVRDIEENTAPPGLASTFLRGYIRSYAKLVHIPEEELLPLMAKQAPVRAAKVAPMQSFSLGKSRKKRDGWLMGFTWLVVFVVIGLTGAWWWQNHQAQQQEIATMADQSSAQLSQGDGQSIPLGNSDDAAAADSSSDTTGTPPDSQAANTAAQPVPVTPDATANAPAAQTPAPAVVAPSQAPVAAPVTTPATAPAAAPADAGAIVMNFNADCWLQVNDATGKTLFSGIQKSGGTLNLNGTAPFKLKIGAPRAVQIQYQGKPVDLSQFIKSNRVARLTLAAE